MKILDTRELELRREELENEYSTWLENLTDQDKETIAFSWEIPLDDMEDANWREAWRYPK